MESDKAHENPERFGDLMAGRRVMLARPHPVFLGIFVVVVAPIGAAVLVAVLLLFGVEPRWVFAPGLAVKSLLERSGFHPANRVAVASTVAFWWAIFVAAGLAWERRRSRSRASSAA